MSSLQKVNLGTPPKAEDGDPVRTANVKANENVDVLSAQSALTSAAQLVDSPQTLTADLHLGRRVNISLAAAGMVQMPDAASCGADGVVLLRNIGTTIATLASKTGSGDSVALSKLNPGEAVLMDTDGVHAWTVLMRGRTNSDNEVVNGNSTVGGNQAVAGALSVKGVASFGSAAQATISAAGAYSGTSATYSGNVTVGGTIAVTGAATFTARPTFANKVPWDTGNLPVPVASSNNAITLTWVGGTTGISCKIDATPIGNIIDSTSAQTITGNKTFSGGIGVVGASFVKGVGSGTYSGATLWLNGDTGVPYLGFSGNTNASAVQLRLNTASGNLELMNFNASAYATLVAANLAASDVRFKTNVETIGNAMDGLRKFRGVRFTMNGKTQLGVIAQEVRGPFPELVEELPQGTEFPPDPNAQPFLGVSYTGLVGPVLQGLLETDELVQRLIARIAALEAKQ